MYTKKELEHAANRIRMIAQEHDLSEAEVRSEMYEAMNAGRNDPDPEVQARWRTFRFAGDEPTVEEFLLWIRSRIPVSG